MGRGSSKVSSGGGGGGKFRDVNSLESHIEKAGPDGDRMFNEFSDAYSAETDYTRDTVKNIKRSIDEGGYDNSTAAIINSEINMTRKEMQRMPSMKTPSQLGQAEALKERIKSLEELKKYRGSKPAASRDVLDDIVTWRRAR